MSTLGKFFRPACLSLVALLYGCGGSSSSPEPTYTVGGTVTGLSGTVVLQLNGAHELNVSSSGSFVFSHALANSATYSVSVLNDPALQACVVTQGSGTINAANVSAVLITCTNAPLMSVVTNTPADGTTGVARTIAPGVVFSTDLSSSSITDQHVTLSSHAGNENVTLDATADLLSITPEDKLLPNTQYTVQVTQGIRGSHDDRLATAFTSQFTTQEGTWQTPSLFVQSTDGAFGATFVYLNTHEGLLAWHQSNGTQFQLRARRYHVDTDVWDPIMIVSSGVGSTSGVNLAVDSTGNVLAAWSQDDLAGSSAAATVYSSYYLTSTESWSTPVALGASDVQQALDITLASDDTGHVWAAWSRLPSTGSGVYSARFDTATHTWSAVTKVSSAQVDSVYGATLTVSAAGDALVAWVETTGNVSTLSVRRRAANAAAWSAAIVLDASSDSVSGVKLAGDAAGNTLLVWGMHEAPIYSGFAKSYDVGTGQWSASVRLENDDLKSFSAPDLAVDSQGFAQAVYVMDGTIVTNRYNFATHQWSAALTLHTPSSSGDYAPGVVMDRAGNATVTWLNVDSTQHHYARRYRHLDDTWGAPEIIDVGSIYSFGTKVGVSPSGDMMAFWTELTFTETNIGMNRFE